MMRNSGTCRESRTVTIVTRSCFYANATGLNILNLFPLLSNKSASAPGLKRGPRVAQHLRLRGQCRRVGEVWRSGNRKTVEISISEIRLGFGGRVRFKGQLLKFAGEEVQL